MALTGTFETGTNGNTIASGDAGSANAWSAVSFPAGGTCVYDNTHAYDTLAAKMATGTTSGEVWVEWQTSVYGTITGADYGRVYVYFTAVPSLNVNFIRVGNSAGANPCLQVRFLPTGFVEFDDGANTVVGVFTDAMPLNQWVRFEYAILAHSATVGQLECKMFSDPNSVTATETITSAADKNTRGNSSSVRFGMTIGRTNQGAFWLDNIVAAATSYPGPAAVFLPKIIRQVN